MQVPFVSLRTIKTQLWCVVIVVVVAMVAEVASLNGPNVCMVKQKYNITKRVKYRAPMSVRTYEWCFSMPPRCSRWNTEMRELTRLETDERTAEVAVCCPGYKMKDVACVPICPNGKTGPGCSDDCPENKWGPNCVNNCTNCSGHGKCSPVTGECECEEGWQGESCESRMSTTQASTTLMEEVLTTTKSTTNTNPLPTTRTFKSATTVSNASTVSSTAVEVTTLTNLLSSTNSPSSISTTTTSPVSITSTTIDPSIKEQALTTESYLITSERNIDHQNLIGIEKMNEIVKSTMSLAATTSTHKYDSFSPTTSAPSSLKITNEDTTSNVFSQTIDNRTETSIEIASTSLISESTFSTSTKMVPFTADTTKYKPSSSTMESRFDPNTTLSTVTTTTEKEYTTKTETTKKPDITTKAPSTIKLKPKEIWIKPAQKGDSVIIDFKIKSNHELTHLRHRGATKKEITSEFTTPRTIIVSIIPTSVSYVTFKKIALTTSSYLPSNNALPKSNKTENGFTYSMAPHTSLPPLIKKIISNTFSRNITFPTTFAPIVSKNATKFEPIFKEKEIDSNITIPITTITNSMTSMEENTSRQNSSNSLTTVSYSTNSQMTLIHKNLTDIVTKKPTAKPFKRNSIDFTTKAVVIIPTHVSMKDVPENVSDRLPKLITTELPTKISIHTNSAESNDSIKNITKVFNKTQSVTTVEPLEDETFHILTEPEHITAVMSDKGRDRSSMDLISVVSIAGGVMMAVITVAVLIVMIERCRRPRFEDVRKVNDIRMQVMIDNNDSPPPYTRSIFHTPLPEPPSTEKCHYQPISTLDRNLKQFMRPVVVQSISPIMLENFRGILECHYDHLPRRNHDFGTMPTRFVTAPSMSYTQELRYQKSRSVTDSTIDASRCEAKLDSIDSTTSEPLYAEIPCWRPPSEHAIEVVNLNGEAITEL
ncbi:unnamed protein product [Parnassius apollo]|uniref:(apollo) hypothetical protein n=1 Tax=Parnassius apollo TaxID=110799 RepID=A0A8S3Y7Q5_PARAO|nr:unnamed protein product [Parnassius apollo]